MLVIHTEEQFPTNDFLNIENDQLNLFHKVVKLIVQSVGLTPSTKYENLTSQLHKCQQ